MTAPTNGCVDGETLWQLIDNRATATPAGQFAVDDRGRTLTFVQYRNWCERVAAAFYELGIGAGDVITWQLPTWNESLVVAGALGRLGAVQNPVLPIYRQREMSFITRQAGAKWLITPRVWRGVDFELMAKEVASKTAGLSLMVVDVGDPSYALPEGDPACLPPPPARSDEVRWLYFTSGTTGEPKGARHTDTSLIASGRVMLWGLQVTPDDRTGLVFPFSHIGGLSWLTCGLFAGCTQIVVEQFDPSTTIELLARENVSLAGSGTAFHLSYLARQRQRPNEKLFPNVRAFPGGAAPKPAGLHLELKSELGGVGILSGWGMTEAPILTMSSPDDPDSKLDSTEGRAGPGVQLRVVKADGSVGAPNEEGELRVKAPNVFQGYIDSSLTAAAFDDEGWLHTGDLGRIDEDGYVSITGRLKDVIIRKGENISAKEIEDLLYAHPKVTDVAVIGLPDAKSGERCCAVVACANADDPLTFVEMVAFLKGQQLMIQKIPEQLEIVDALPRNAAMKVSKHELRAKYASG
jgi:cyclohexanecarboxylate-CoA ligase